MNESNALQRFHRPRLLHFLATVLANAPRIVVPKIEHGFAEMLDDVGAIEINVFDQRPAILTIKNHVFVLPGRAATLDHNPDGVRRPDRSMRNIGRDEERLAFAHEVIHDLVAFADSHFDVAFELVKILLRIDQMKIVSRVWAFNYHDKKIAPVIKIAIADRRLEFLPVFFDPIFQINGRLNGVGGPFFGRCACWLSESGHETSVFPWQ